MPTWPKQRKAFENGFGFKVWLDRLFPASGLPGDSCGCHAADPRPDVSDDHGHSKTDPHLWHDPEFAIEISGTVAAALVKADPAHAHNRRKNAGACITLQELKTCFQSQITTLPDARRRLVTPHDTCGCFAKRFGFQVSSVMGTVSSDVAEPSAAQIAAILDTIRPEPVPAIFAESLLNPQLTDQVAREAGVRVVPTLFRDALGEKGSDWESYLQVMRSSVTKLVESLRQYYSKSQSFAVKHPPTLLLLYVAFLNLDLRLPYGGRGHKDPQPGCSAVDIQIQNARVRSEHFTASALSDASLVGNVGERVGVVGPNGAGKSAQLKTIAGLLKPVS